MPVTEIGPGKWGHTLLPHMVQDSYEAAKYYGDRAELELHSPETNEAEQILDGAPVPDGKLTTENVKGIAKIGFREAHLEQNRAEGNRAIIDVFKEYSLSDTKANGDRLRGALALQGLSFPFSRDDLRAAVEELRGDLEFLKGAPKAEGFDAAEAYTLPLDELRRRADAQMRRI